MTMIFNSTIASWSSRPLIKPIATQPVPHKSPNRDELIENRSPITNNQPNTHSPNLTVRQPDLPNDSSGNLLVVPSPRSAGSHRRSPSSNQSIPKSIAPRCSMALSDFDIGKPLGRGKYGRVYLARTRATGHIVALKCLSLDQLADGEMAHQLQREIEIQTNLRHKNVIALYQFFYDSSCVYLVLEYAAKGELFAHLRRAKRFNEAKTARLIHDLTLALMYCHSKHVIHRDLKPENLLLGASNDVKIADFGWSVHAPNATLINRRQTICGTPDYLPPEMIMRKGHDASADLWCLGVLMYELLVGIAPFTSGQPKATYARILEVDLKWPRSLPLTEHSKDLVRKLLVKEPKSRLSLAKVLAHPFITTFYKPPSQSSNHSDSSSQPSQPAAQMQEQSQSQQHQTAIPPPLPAHPPTPIAAQSINQPSNQ